MAQTDDFIGELAKALRPVEEANNADVIFYSGGIYPPSDTEILALTAHKRRANLLLMLTTLGGSPDVAYRIARTLRNTYENGQFILFVNTVCKSAGTLVALAVDSLIMSDSAHLGPLDIQVQSKDEVGEMSSGLTPSQSLSTLKAEAWRLFDDLFTKLRVRPGFSFSTKMSAQIAARISIGLLRPIYEQIDPMRLGENERAMRIAADYGQRLSSKSNLKDRALARLVSGYPSHSFVIDRHEASELFKNVRLPSSDEIALASHLKYLVNAGQKDDENGLPATIYSLSAITYEHEASKIEGGASNEQDSAKTNRSGKEASRQPDGSAPGAGQTATPEKPVDLPSPPAQ